MLKNENNIYLLPLWWQTERNEVSKQKHWKFNIAIKGIYFFLYIYDNRPLHFFCCRFFVFFSWVFACHFLEPGSQDFLAFSLSRARAKEVFYVSPRICNSFQNREEPLTHFEKRFCSKGDNGFENTLRWHCRKLLQFDDNCYVCLDVKQYHLTSFSTLNFMLNTSLCWPIRMRDFIQLCNSVVNWFCYWQHSVTIILSIGLEIISQSYFIQSAFSILCLRNLISFCSVYNFISNIERMQGSHFEI